MVVTAVVCFLRPLTVGQQTPLLSLSMSVLLPASVTAILVLQGAQAATVFLLSFFLGGGDFQAACPSLHRQGSVSKTHYFTPGIACMFIPIFSFLWPPEQFQEVSSQSSVLDMSQLQVRQCQLALLLSRPHHFHVCFSGFYTKCSLNVLRSIQSNLVRTRRKKGNIYLLSCHFSQMNELNIFIALKINYFLSPGWQ